MTRIINYSLLIVFTIVLLSCTTVIFNVEHPPVVDLRNVNRITVIPFEWSTWNDERLARNVTSALTLGIRNGIRRGNIDFINPQVLRNVSPQSYWMHVDVYIIGSIIDVTSHSQIETREITRWGETRTANIITRTVYVTIDYSYIRSTDNEVLGYFKKTEQSSTIHEEFRNQHTRPPPSYNTSSRRGGGSGNMRGRGGRRDTIREPWEYNIAESAIIQFAGTMTQELGPWSSFERRNIRRITGNNTFAAQAKRLVRQGRYQEALEIYQTLYEENGSLATGYNTAILLIGANRQFVDALELLQSIHWGLQRSGERIPFFLLDEIRKLTRFINGFEILEAYRTDLTASVSGTAIMESVQNIPAGSRELTGTVNLHQSMIYSLNDSISSLEDDSVFFKIVGFTYADGEGQWSMSIPNTASSLLWLVVVDSNQNYFITKTALNTSGMVALNTAEMDRLQ